MDKAEILAIIRRMAAANGGKAPGRDKFESETGLGKWIWYPKYWLRWGDAVREAGCEPNALSASLGDEALIRKYLELALELGRFPIEGDIFNKRRKDKSFPNRDAFLRLGGKGERAAKMLAYCRSHAEFEAAIPLVAPAVRQSTAGEAADVEDAEPGYVYLIRHGTRHEYKIGRTNNRLRREGEIRLELPHGIESVHVIETDDPSGIEAYWHRRFADKRLEGEWFSLRAADVRAFKRWKRIF